MTFEVGDKVIYPNHGLGIVERIEEKTILGTTCGFYHLRIVANETTVLVPVSQRRRRRPAPRDQRRGSRTAVRPARRRQDRQPSELERALQGQLRQDAQRLDLRRRRRAEEPDVPRQVEEPLVPREAHARSRQVPHHLGSVRSDARNRAGDRRPRRPRARALLLDQGPDDGARQGGQGRTARDAGGRTARAARAASRSVAVERQTPAAASAAASVHRRDSPTPAQARRPRRRAFSFIIRRRAHRRRPLRRDLRRRFPLRARSSAAVGMLLAIAVRLEGPAVHPRPRRRQLGLWLCGHPLPGRRARSTCRSTAPPSTARIIRATSIRRCCSTALHPRMHILYKHEIDQIPVLARAFRLGGFIPIDRRNKEAAMRSIEAGAAIDPVGQLVPDFSGRHPQQDRGAAAVQEGRLHHGDQGRAPIVPVAIQGGRAAMRRGSAIIRPVNISIRIGAADRDRRLHLDDRDELIAPSARADCRPARASGPIGHRSLAVCIECRHCGRRFAS